MSGLVLTILGPVVIGPLTFLAMQGLKRVNTLIDEMPPLGKRFAVVAIAGVMTLVANWAGVDLHCDANAESSCLTLLNQDAVKAIVAAVVAFGLHALKTANKQQG